MRIVVFAWRDLAHPRAGGAEVYVHEVSRCWIARGHHVTVVTAAVAGSPARERVDGVDIVRGGSALGVYRHARRWYATTGRGRTDLVVDEINTRPFGCPAWVDDAPVVALAHQVCREVWNAEMPLPMALLGRYVLEPRWLRAYARIPVCTVSASSAESLRMYGMGEVGVVGVGAATRARPAVPEPIVPTLIWIGRLTPNKRPDHAIAAFELVRAALPDAVLHVVGDGPMRGRLQRHIPGGVQLHGRVPLTLRDELLAGSHALLVTSVREGWGMVVDEAAAMGTPAFGYDVPGLRESIASAAGTVTAARPAALAAAVTAAFPRLKAEAGRPGWPGGARPWGEVAEAILEFAGVPSTGQVAV